MEMDETNLVRLCIKSTEMAFSPAETRVMPFREWIWQDICRVFHRIRWSLSSTYRTRFLEQMRAAEARSREEGRAYAEEVQRDRERQATDPQFWQDPLVAAVKAYADSTGADPRKAAAHVLSLRRQWPHMPPEEREVWATTGEGPTLLKVAFLSVDDPYLGPKTTD